MDVQPGEMVTKKGRKSWHDRTFMHQAFKPRIPEDFELKHFDVGCGKCEVCEQEGAERLCNTWVRRVSGMIPHFKKHGLVKWYIGAGMAVGQILLEFVRALARAAKKEM